MSYNDYDVYFHEKGHKSTKRNFWTVAASSPEYAKRSFKNQFKNCTIEKVIRRK